MNLSQIMVILGVLKVWCSKLTMLKKTVQKPNILRHYTLFIYWCVKFQYHLPNITKVINARGMIGKTGLGW